MSNERLQEKNAQASPQANFNIQRSLFDVLRFFRYAPATRWTVITCLSAYLIQSVCSRVDCVAGYSFDYLLWHCFGLCPALFAAGFFWQVLTYMFLHANLMHLGMNMLGVLLLGAGVEQEIGTPRFLRVFLLGGVVGGLAWVLFDLATVRLAEGVNGLPVWLTTFAEAVMQRRIVTSEGNAICLGASGGVFALIGVCAALFPRRQMLVFLVWPVRIIYLAMALGIGTVAFALYEPGHVAHLAHLAGGLAGYAYGWRLAACRSFGRNIEYRIRNHES